MNRFVHCALQWTGIPFIPVCNSYLVPGAPGVSFWILHELYQDKVVMDVDII